MLNAKIFQITDLHFGNKIVKADVMYKNYTSFLNDNRTTIASSDIFLLTGDIPDSLLYSNGEAYSYMVKFMLHVAGICVKHNLTMIYLEGTPLHEMSQMKVVSSIITDAYPDLEYRYHNDLAFHTLEKYDMTYITVPDQITKDDETLFLGVRKLLRANNVSKVDFMFTHTSYEEAIKYADDKTKSTKVWSNMVDKLILNGHIHQYSFHNKVITCGALDFICHGDTETKGGLFVKVIDNSAVAKFIPNKHVSTFLTIETDNPIVVAQKHIDRLNVSRKVYHLRIVGYVDATVASKLKLDNPLLRLTILKPKTAIEVREEEELSTNIITSFDITPENVIALIEEELAMKDELLVKELQVIMKEVQQ